jgi:Tfp pilus assembly protein PilF
VIYCINPYCNGQENLDDAELCASCGMPVFVASRLKVIGKISSDPEMDVFEVIESQTTFSGEAGTHKILKVLKSTDSDRVKAFETEALILQSLQHPTIPKVDVISDYFEIDVVAVNRRLRCLVMSKFEGITLEDYILSNGAVSQQIAIDYLQQLAATLNYIQTERINDEGGVIHRDIKPRNIIVQPSGKLALIDFGFSLIMTSTYQSRLASGIGEPSKVETIYYTPPEQIARKPIPQSDFFALGMTIIFAITGRQLYDMEMRSWQPQWQNYAKHLDKPFIQFLERLTSSDSYKRPSSAEELLRIVSQTLPAKLKWRNRFRSTPYRIVFGAMATLVGVGLFHLGRNGLYEYYFSTGSRAVDDNRFAEARQQFQSAINILHKGEAYNNLGIVCSRLGDFDCAFKAYQNATRSNPTAWEGYYQLGSFFEENAQPDITQAEKYYRKALSINPKAVQPLNNMARVLILQRRYQEAKPLIAKTLKLTSEPYYNAILKKNLGWINLEQKKYSEAELYLKQAIALDSTLISPYCLLAKLYEAQKRNLANEIQLCLVLNGDDVLNIEVIRWRSEMIDRLLKNKSTSTINTYSS